jgi:hypothetical protein
MTLRKKALRPCCFLCGKEHPPFTLFCPFAVEVWCEACAARVSASRKREMVRSFRVSAWRWFQGKLPGLRKNKECVMCESRVPSVKRRLNGEILCDHCSSDIDADQ